MEEEFELPLRAEPEVLTLALGAWEGPLDLLLALARRRRSISSRSRSSPWSSNISPSSTRRARCKLELAADYLVMAAWLAYLKSALLLPRDPEVEPSPEELALRLQLRLAAARRDARGGRAADGARPASGATSSCAARPKDCALVRKPVWEATLYDLIAAYGAVKARNRPVFHIVARRPVMTLDEALDRVVDGWSASGSNGRRWKLPAAGAASPTLSLGAGVEFRRRARTGAAGRLELRQEAAFAPLMVQAPA